ncbi:MAG: putative DNA binding domain-containing protein [Candidatus Cloacimonetes bacterium]|jgi:ATP-dependent DNA helicase RecG|nr:putative DNA binding domain-containing protein [Candidatus Cloacimonadota bacterium]
MNVHETHSTIGNYDMTVEELKILISKGEGLQLEFKQTFNIETIETLVAFANTNGGKVLIGVSDTGILTGVSINVESVQNWLNEIKMKTSPSFLPEEDVVEFGKKYIIVFTVQEYPIKPVSTKGKYYKRVANSNHLLSISEVVNMHLKSFNTSWDYHINNQFKIDDISLEKVQLAIDNINQSGAKITDDPITFLVKNDLVRDGLVTNAAFLLFANRDSVVTTIELGRFQTETIIKDTARTKSDILSQINQVMDFVKKHINKEIIITGQPQNIQKWQYPLEAIREVILNMIIHRDYRSSSDSIVKIFNDKIEFYNPGRLPESISVDDLLSNNYRSTPRNKLIADFCKSLGVIEKYGSGIRRVVNYCNLGSYPIPDFKNISEGFMVTFYSVRNETSGKNVVENVVDHVVENVVEHVAESRINKILNLMAENKQISAAQIAIILNTTDRTVQRDIEKLQKRNILKRIGPAKGGHWEIIK